MEKQIVEFIPVELIIVYDSNDLPEQHYRLLMTWLKEKCDYDGDLISDVWDYGLEIRIIHWEWRCGSEYYLVVDICGNPSDKEEGIICIQNDVIFENNNQKLSVLQKSVLNSRLKAFEHVRKFSNDPLQHCKYVLELYEELRDDLEEESVDEEEFKDIVQTDYIHQSDDDASEVSESESS